MEKKYPVEKTNSKLNSIDWFDLLQSYRKFASSELAAEKILTTSPLNSTEEALASFKEIEEAQSTLNHGDRPFYEGLDLSISWLPRIEKESILKPLELKDIRLFLNETQQTYELLELAENGFSTRYANELLDFEEPLSAIDQLLGPGGEIRTDASETLFKLTNEKSQLAKQLEKSLDRLVKENELEPVLQDRFVTNREGRWVVPVKSGRQHDLSGIIHATSHSKQTVFMEPQEVVPMNNRLKKIDVEIEEEIERLLRELSLYLHQLHDDFKRTQLALIHIDVRFAQAQLSRKMKANAIQFSPIQIDLTRLRNPMLSLDLSNVVANDIFLDPDQSILLLSGPNAGGKTVLLKSIGLASQMARCGLLVCASPESSLPFFKEIFTSVGDHQSVDQHLSTFAAHLKDLNTCLDASGSDSLILIDEMCGSTDPEEGGAIARAFIEEYAQNGVFAVITSHLGPLKTGWSEKDRVINGSLAYNESSNMPTYQFISGISGSSLALQTAQRVGVSSEIIDRAKNYMSLESQERLSEVDKLEEEKEKFERLRGEMRKSKQEAEKTKSKYEKKLKEIESQVELEVERRVKQATREVDAVVKKARIDGIFRNHAEVQNLQKSKTEIVRAKTSPDICQSVDEFRKKYPKGSGVYISSLRKNGIVQSEPNGKGEVSILSDSMRLQLPWQQLESPQAQSQPKKQKSLRRGQGHYIEPADPTIDLRGKRVEEAIEDLELKLDAAAKNEEDRVKIIHGHGTDALKKAVRNHLSRSVYVVSWQAGSPETGGDGITWVRL